jgi:hypothetical protein
MTAVGDDGFAVHMHFAREVAVAAGDEAVDQRLRRCAGELRSLGVELEPRQEAFLFAILGL